MENIERKHALYRQVGLIAKALGHEMRLEIIELLTQCPHTVEKIAELLNANVKTVSAQLKILASAGLVKSQRQGRFVLYSLADENAVRLAVMLQSAAPNVLDCSTGDASTLSMSIDDAVNEAQLGQLLLIDVRPSDEFHAGHLPCAKNMPLDSLGDNIKELPDDKKLVAYCRGAYCFKAKEAAKVFARYGKKLDILSTGVMEWVSRGKALSQ